MYSSSPNKIVQRREFIFLLLSGLFLGSMTMLNILGTSKIIDTGIAFGKYKMTMPVGVLAYPITFLCTDFVSELYGKTRANTLVWIGLIVNIWVLLILKIGDSLPELFLSNNNYSTFSAIKTIATDTIFGSMIAYMTAQFVDVYIFHYFKEKNKGKKLWLRNNVSTLVSQLIDSVIVILYVHYANDTFHMAGQPEDVVNQFLINTIISTYLFKFFFALIDTIPFYFGVKFLTKWLRL